MTIRRMGRSHGKMSAGGFLVLFGLFWSAITLAFDGFLGWSAYNQIRAENYPTTSGVVAHSEVERHSGKKGSTYSPDIKYRYTVAGKEYFGNRYRFGQGSSNDNSAQRIVGEHPVGKQVTVYYNPDRPADAVLRPGLEGGDLFMAMFLLPFNLVMLGIWSAIGYAVWDRLVGSPTGGAPVRDDGFQVRVRLVQWAPLVLAAAVSGFLAFVAIFVVAFGFGGFHPSMSVMLVIWPVILVGGLLASIWSLWKVAQGGNDLVLDATAQTITLPRSRGRNTDVVVPMRDITSVEVQRVEKRGSRGSLSYSYVPTLVFTDESGSACQAELVEWWDAGRTERFAAWLREQLRLETPRGDFAQVDRNYR